MRNYLSCRFHNDQLVSITGVCKASELRAQIRELQEVLQSDDGR